MWQKNRWVALAVAMAVGLMVDTAGAVVIRSDQSDSLYTSLGASSEYSSVGRFDGTTTSSGFLASGTLIAPSWVLTAAHVVDNATSLTFTIGGHQYYGDRMVSNPGWNRDLWAGYDIGLVHLSTPVPNVTPALRYAGSAELKQVGTMVGYGKTGTGNTGGTTLDGQKRGAQNAIDQVLNSRLLLSDFDNPRSRSSGSLGSSDPQPLEGLIAPGDSGGGIFINSGIGTYLAGVNSFVGSHDGLTDSGYGDISGYTRVSTFNQWIDGVLNGQSPIAIAPTLPLEATSGEAPSMTHALVPEPGTLGLLSAAGLLLLLARRCRRRAGKTDC